MPPDEIGPLLPVSKEEVDIFNDILSDEIDSGFGSSICCCDFCYADFKEHWPGLAFLDMTFQTQSMGAFWLVEYSRLPGIYSPAEISTLKRLVFCPRCLQYGAYNVWAYEHRFSDVEEIEQSIEELSALGAATPFLLLEHPFAKRVLDEIRALANTTTKTVLEKSIYRARLADSVGSCGQEPDSLQTYAAPPASHAGEGRFNHAGAPMLYLASSAETAAAELGAPGSTCHVAQLQLKTPLLVLDLVDIEEGDPGYELLGSSQLGPHGAAADRRRLGETPVCFFTLRWGLRSLGRIRRHSLWLDETAGRLELCAARSTAGAHLNRRT